MKTAMLIWSLLLLTQVASAGKISEIVSADCVSTKGYLKLDRKLNSLAGKLSTTPELILPAQGSGVQLAQEYPAKNYQILGALVTSRDENTMGTLGLIVKGNHDLSSNETLDVFFSDFFGNGKSEKMQCRLTF